MNEPISTEALKQKNILLTGSSGFLGKVVLEKLLRCVPEIGNIYLLIRPTSSYPTAKQRFYNEIYSSSIFDKLKKDPFVNFKQLCALKLRFITGELAEHNFGLEQHHFNRLAHKIDLIINSAASVNFREPLDSALKINAFSLYNISKLSKPNRSPVVQVSTCYVNGLNKGLIHEESISPTGLNLEKGSGNFYNIEPLIEHLQKEIQFIHNQPLTENEKRRLLIRLGVKASRQCGWNDSYTFTKWLGEQILIQELQGQGLTIVRPSIIESTLIGPVPGWIEGVKVADAIILAYAREKISLFPGNRNAVIDIIPADLVANSIVLSAAEALTSQPIHRIYQCCSSYCNPITIRDVIRLVQNEAQSSYDQYPNLFYRRPQKPFVMIPGFAFNSIIYAGYQVVKSKDQVTTFLGKAKKSKLQKNLETVIQLSSIFSPYTQPNYIFSNQKLCSMSSRVNTKEQQAFPVNASVLDWEHYLAKVHIFGLNQYALAPEVKQKESNTKVTRQRKTEAA